MKKFNLVLTIMLVIAYLLPLHPVSSAPAIASSTTPTSNIQFSSALLKQISITKKMRVFVKLQQPFIMENQLTTQSIQAQRQQIHTQQQQLFQQLQVSAEDIKTNRAITYETIPYVALEVNEAELQQLTKNTNVQQIVEDRTYTLPKQPQAPQTNSITPQVASSNTVMKTSVAWNAGYTGKGWTVAVIDSGVDKRHPYLAGKVVSEACYTISSCPGGASSSTSSGSAATDSEGHGTHVSGIIAGKNSTFSGVAKDAKIIAINIFGSMGGTSDSLIIKGLERVYQLRNTFKIAAVNMSLGDSTQNTTYCNDDPSAPMIQQLKAAKIATIIAAGNESRNGSISSPACISSAISVGATDDSDHVAYFSNSSSLVTLLAPGHPVQSSVPGGKYESWSGTSMATPQVAGAFAIYRQKYPTYTVDQIKNELILKGKKITDRNKIVKPRLDFSKFNTTIITLDKVNPPTWSGDTLQWTAVSQASYYSVTLYCNSVKTYTEKVSATTTKLNLASKMTQPGLYTATVQALGNQTTSLDGAVSNSSNSLAKSIAYFENFESTNGKFQITGDSPSWAWGIPLAGPTTAHSGKKVWATDLEYGYNDYENSYIESPAIDLSKYNANLSLNWWQFVAVEDGWDDIRVEVSKDGGSHWTQVYTSSVTVETWTKKAISLDASYAVSNFKVRFGMTSDESSSADGFFIDDVYITAKYITPLPQVSQPTWQSNSITWVDVAKAKSYEVTLYYGDTKITTVTVAPGVQTYNFSDLLTQLGSYYVTVKAIGDHTTAADGLVSERSTALTIEQTTFYSENFETGDGGFSASASSNASSMWVRGVPSIVASKPNEGTTVWATNLTGNYNNYSSTTLTSPTIDLRNAKLGSKINWWQYVDTESKFDNLWVDFSNDNGQTWTNTYNSSGYDGNWTQQEIGLDASNFVSTFKIRFRFTSDYSVTSQGVLLDDLSITGVAKAK